MRLRVKGPAGQFLLLLTFAHHPLHILLRQFQVSQQHPLKLAAPVGALGDLAHSFQRQGQVAFEDFLAEFEKRWGKLEPRIDERWHEHERVHRAAEERVERLEGVPAPLQEQISMLRNDHDKFLQAFIEAVTGLVETKSTLPQYPVPPAQAPEDGLGLPSSMLDRR